MSKRILALVFVIALLITAIPFSASALLSEQGFDFYISDGKAYLTAHNDPSPGPSGDLVVPETLGGCPVYAIDYAAYQIQGITGFEMCDTIEIVDHFAFAQCTGLVKVKFSAGLKSIGQYAFYNTDLAEIELPEGLEEIGVNAFGYNTRLKSVNIPSTVTKLAGNFLTNCTSLEEITVTPGNSEYKTVDGVLYTKDMKTLLLYPCARSGETFTVPNTVETIAIGAFSGSVNLKTVILPNSLTKISEEAFWGSSITSIVIPDSVTEIGKYAFFKSAIESIDLPKGLTEIPDSCFNQCYNLKQIVIPESVIDIGGSAFSNTALTHISIPKSVGHIGYSILHDCVNLKKIIVHTNTNSLAQAFSAIESDVIIYANENSAAYRQALNYGYKCEPLNTVCEITNVEHTYSNGSDVFEITASEFANRVKITYANDLKSYIAYSDKYTYDANGNKVFTVAVPAKNGTVEYAFDVRSSYIGKYMRDYFYKTVENVTNESGIADITYEVKNGSVEFRVVAAPGFNRVKVSLSDSPSSYVAYAGSKATDEHENEIFILKVPAVYGTTDYVFTGRNAETNKYEYKKSVNLSVTVNSVESEPEILSVEHKISGGKIIFTVITSSNDFDRVKVTLSSNLSGSLAIGKNPVVNESGKFVWTVKTAAPKENTKYAFDVRAAGGSYLKSYYIYEAKIEPKIISASGVAFDDGSIIFTVITKPGNFDRIKVTSASALASSIAVSNSYTVNGNGNYVWTIKARTQILEEGFAFDLREAGGSYYKDYFFFNNVEGVFPDHTDSSIWDKVVDRVFTSSNGGIQLYMPGWKTFGMYGLSVVPESYNNTGTTNCIMIKVYDKSSGSYDSPEAFENKTKSDFEAVLQANLDTFEKTKISYNGKSYTCYKAVATGLYYVWVFQTEEAKYFINFLQASEDFSAESKQIMSTIRIYY